MEGSIPGALNIAPEQIEDLAVVRKNPSVINKIRNEQAFAAVSHYAESRSFA